MRENVVTTESTSGENISEEAIREALSRILEGAMSIQSDGLSRFLRFTVEATLAGEADIRPGQNVSKRNQIRKVVSMSLRKSHRH